MAGIGAFLGNDEEARPSYDHTSAVSTAQTNSRNSGDTGLFSAALHFVKDEDAVKETHNQAYGQKSASLDASSLGSAAAVQALKVFTGGGGSGSSQSQLVGFAMSEAANLFDSQGSNEGSKQDAVNSAALTVSKFLFQAKLKSTLGIGGGGVEGSVVNLAAKFL
ncbi:uncharacterized protein EI90DRAFT_2561759 [Cantharellus anzutake]|uniref:uncharacterized protein n=1 Tax=Cantharellus anzutake TaxID=1750568 RepID=UPI001907354E|nr:uncharacterized protein EI90DRAFT_2561759 [Cantharellus anzutake]KAF8338238.1 hypothetical protein EI90DRAFT_2561759 [Cantharellus anzutake]